MNRTSNRHPGNLCNSVVDQIFPTNSRSSPIPQVGVARFACIDKVVACVVNHSCLVSIFACFEIHEAFVTCMEYIRGVDLHKVLKVSKVFPRDVLQLVTAQLGLAIQHVHFKGFIHRDVKVAPLQNRLFVMHTSSFLGAYLHRIMGHGEARYIIDTVLSVGR